MRLVLLLFFALVNTGSVASELVFKLKGRRLESVTLKQMKSKIVKLKKGEIHSTKVTLYNVFRGYEKTYEGYSFFELLTLVFGPEWKQREKLIFTSSDGYHQISPIASLLKLTQSKMGLIAFTEVGRNGFTEILKGGKRINPGPFYLVWTHFKEEDKASHGDIIKWPYQLSDIDIE